jgi:hypothetical protein
VVDNEGSTERGGKPSSSNPSASNSRKITDLNVFAYPWVVWRWGLQHSFFFGHVIINVVCGSGVRVALGVSTLKKPDSATRSAGLRLMF